MNMREKARLLGALDCGFVTYLGGHKKFPQPILCEIFFYEHRFDIGTEISVHYSKIKDITNSNEMKRETDRLAAGLLFAPLALAYLFKKNHVYTIIEYDDGVDTQKIVLDFEKSANYAQGLIYTKMLESRVSPKGSVTPKNSGSGSPF
jgi:hypothetical protein